MAAPANDNFANRILIEDALPWTVVGDNTDATTETGEPSYGYHSIWYEWISPSTGVYAIDTEGSTVLSDSKLGVYTGEAVDALTIIAQDDDGGTGNLSKVGFLATEGVSYKIAVTGYGSGNYGSFNLNGALLFEGALPSSVEVATGVHYNDYDALCRASDGTLYIGYVKSDHSVAYLAYSIDDGDTWNNETIPNISGVMATISILADLNGDVHAIFSDDRKLCYCKRTGGSWGSVSTVLDSTSWYYLKLTIDSSNNPHVFYQYTVPNPDTIVHAYIDGTWTTETVSNPTKTSTFDYDASAVCVDSLDGLHVLYRGSGYGTYTTRNKVIYAYKVAGGSWDLTVLSSDIDYNSDPYGMSIDMDGDVHVVYAERDVPLGWYKTHYKKKIYGTWGSEEEIFPGKYTWDSYYGYILPTRNPDIVYFLFSDWDNFFIVKRDIGVWGTELQITYGGNLGWGCSFSSYPVQNIPSAGYHWVSYEYTGSSTYKIAYFRSTDLYFGNIPSVVNALALGFKVDLYSPSSDYWLAMANAMNFKMDVYPAGINTNIYEAPYFSTGLDLYRPAILDPTLEINIAPIGLSADKINSTVIMSQSGSKSISLSTTNNRRATKLDTLLRKPIVFHYRTWRRISPP